MKETTYTLKLAKHLGYSVSRTKNGHIKFRGFGNIIYSSSTPSDCRSITTVRNNLKKLAHGIPIAKL